MKLFSTILKAVLPALAIATAAPAFAQAEATASTSAAGYVLIDLDPYDGVSPWITFANESIASSSALLLADLGGVPRPVMEAYGNTFGTVLVGNDAGLALAASGAGSVVSLAQAFADSASAWASVRESFLLSPNTAVTFIAYGYAKAAGADDFAASSLYVASGDNFSSGSQLSASGGETSEGLLFASAGGLGADPVQGWIGMNVYAVAMASPVAAPVPEPAQALMLLGGLGLLGAAGLRRVGGLRPRGR